MKLVSAWSPLVVLALALASAPLASGKAIPADLYLDRFSVEVPFAPAEIATDVAFEYRCSGFSTVDSSSPQNVSFFIDKAPAWMTARVEPARIELPLCEGVGNVSARLLASAAEGSHALPTDELVLRAAWETDGMVINLTQTIPATPPFVPRVRVDAGETTQMSRPQTPVVFPVKIVNLASGTTRISFELVSKDDALMVPVPNPVVLQHRGGQDTAEVPFTVQTPYRNGPMDEVGEVTYRVTPSAALDPQVKGESILLSFVVHTKGFYVPGPDAGLLVALLMVVGTLVAPHGTRRRD